MASSETSKSRTPKRQRADSWDRAQSLQYDDYTVGWISALPLEMTAAQAMLDHRHESLPQYPQDSNCYEFGSINGHNVVIACLPKAQYGNNNAAIVANNMNRSFPNLQYRLLVGIGGGVPGAVDVRLGDVVVSTHAIQYDLGKSMPNNRFQQISEPIRPPQALLTVVSKIEASHRGGRIRMLEFLSETAARLPQYAHPGVEDRLFHNDCIHTSSGMECCGCGQSLPVLRGTRPSPGPVIHYGRVASGNQVIKDAHTRDVLAKKIKNICFEMEAAGVMDSFPCLVIRGICDYSDSRKNKAWQDYAALVAAAYVKELLISIAPPLPQSRKRVRVQQPEAPELINTEAGQCLRAMFVTDSSLDRESILDAKGDICQGTCEWILSTDEFKGWDQNPPHLLWLSAPPGMGKTFMSVYLSKHFEASTRAPESATIYFFCENKVETRNTATSILRSLMYQLISYQPNLVNTITSEWEQQSLQLFEESSFGILWKLFEDIIVRSDFRTIYCVIDALDECEANSLSLLLRKFERLSQGYSRSSTKLKLVCTSRRYPENIPEALLLFTKMEFESMPARKGDTRRFISSQVQELARKKKLNHEMCSRLEETFQQKSEGTFLWVSFMSQDLQKQRLLDFEESLKKLPAGLDGVYERIVNDIDFEKRGMVHGILYWTLVATRPFTIQELCEAVDISSTRFLTRQEVCIELIKSCGHLLQIKDQFAGNSWKRTVTFLHQSAKDYLMKFEPLFGPRMPGLAFPQLHEHATITLIQYLGRISYQPDIEYKEVEALGNDLPLAEYAVRNWHLHFENLEDITQVMDQSARFFKRDSDIRLTWQTIYDFQDTEQDSPPMPLLHLSASLGLNSLAEWCLKRDGQNDLEIEWGILKQTALVVACEMQREYIVTLLLDAGADAIARGSFGISALETAISHCKRRFLRLMVQRKSCRQWLNQQASKKDGALFDSAAFSGNLDACRFLIEDLGWDLNWQNGRVGYSALESALEGGKFELVSCFIREWNVPVMDHWDTLELTCLSSASANDFEQIIRLLVEHCSVDINALDGEGHNALCTIFKGRSIWALSSTRTLLQFGCSPDAPDRFGRTPMHCLAMKAFHTYWPNFADIMELLVGNSQRGINQVCLEGKTVLHYLIQALSSLEAELSVSISALVSEVARSFLDLGVDRYIRNHRGLTALETLRQFFDQPEEEKGHHSEQYEEDVKEFITVLQDYNTVTKH